MFESEMFITVTNELARRQRFKGGTVDFFGEK